MSTEPGSDNNRIEIFLDDDPEPIVTHRPPVRFQLDTARLSDGTHTLHIRAYDSNDQQGIRSIPFTVRNGPGIAVSGLSDDEVLEGSIPILVNAYGGRREAYWDPSLAETPAPIPTWIWVLFIVIVAFAVFYGVRQWSPPPAIAASPTYSNSQNTSNGNGTTQNTAQ